MSITLSVGESISLSIDNLTSLKSGLPTELLLGMEFGVHLHAPISTVPENHASTTVEYKSGNQSWSLAPTTFELSGAVKGRIQILKPKAKIAEYVDTLALQSEFGASAIKDAAPKAKAINVAEDKYYLSIELTFGVAGKVSATYQHGIYGLSANSSGAANVAIAFYKCCAPTTLLQDALTAGFRDLVLPFHAKTLEHLQPGDYLRHTADENLQLGMGAQIGFGSFSKAAQWASALPVAAGVPQLKAGVSVSGKAGAALTYAFDYKGSFDHLLWKTSATSAQVHLYRTREKDSDLSFKIEGGVTSKASETIKKQLATAASSSSNDAQLAALLSQVFYKQVDALVSYSKELNDKITALLKKSNDATQAGLEWAIDKQTDCNFMLMDFAVHLDKPDYASAWDAMIHGRWREALETANGAVELSKNSGLERVYDQCSALKLNFFGTWKATWSTDWINESTLLYAGNNTFHLVAKEGIAQRAGITSKGKTKGREADFYFSSEFDLSDTPAAPEPPDLHLMLRGENNKKFGNLIAVVFGNLCQGTEADRIANLLAASAGSSEATQKLEIVLKPSAYVRLVCSPQPIKHGDDQADRNNYAAFVSAAQQTMGDGIESFEYNNHTLDYPLWSRWNIACNDQSEAGEGAQPERRNCGSPTAGFAWLMDSLKTSETDSKLLAAVLLTASGFMNFCEDLKAMSSPSNVAQGSLSPEERWKRFTGMLEDLIKADVSPDFLVPTALALAERCRDASKQTMTLPNEGAATIHTLNVQIVCG